VPEAIPVAAFQPPGVYIDVLTIYEEGVYSSLAFLSLRSLGATQSANSNTRPATLAKMNKLRLKYHVHAPYSLRKVARRVRAIC
jgi:hypothetical protein